MSYSILRHSPVLASVLSLAGFAAGCATVVTPLSNSDSVSVDKSHGLLFGSMRFAWHGPDQAKGFPQPQGMQWMLEEKAKGKRFVLANLPTDGSFVLKLPAGSYRVKSISFDGRETWQAMLPTTFQVQPRGCTSPGLWDLQSENQFSGWITGHVLENLEPAPGELQRILAAKECPTLAAPPLDSSMRRKLAFQNDAWEREDHNYID